MIRGRIYLEIFTYCSFLCAIPCITFTFFMLLAEPAFSHTYYVNPDHDNASDGNNYACNIRSSCDPINLIAAGYGTHTQPFGGINEAVMQIAQYGSHVPHTIYVAPGIYRENIYMAGRQDFTIIADTGGVETGTAPGEVIVTGAEALDALQFVPYQGYEGVYVLYDASYPDGKSLCLTRAERGNKDCIIKMIIETNNPDAYRISYAHQPDIASVFAGNGRFYYDIDETDPDNPVLDIYLRTFDGNMPTSSLGLELLIEQIAGDYTLDFFWKHRHCFDLEGGARRNYIEGFTCRYTSSYGVHVYDGSNMIRGNLIYGSANSGLLVGRGSAVSLEPAIIDGNEISHSGIGIHVANDDDDVYIENNVIHNNISSGIFVNVYTPADTTIYIGNNTIHGNGANLKVGQHQTLPSYGEIVAVNNTFSDALFCNFRFFSNGSGYFSHNNWYGIGGCGINPFSEINPVYTDPMFRNITWFDFYLLSGSGLIDAGTHSEIDGYEPPSLDKNSLDRTLPYDIGAYEFVATGCNDNDNDGYGNPGHSSCYYGEAIDCDDDDDNIYPGGPRARIINIPPLYFSLIQEAYDSSLNNDIIEIQDATMIENISFDISKVITLQGGFDCSYSSNTGISRIMGDMTVMSGSIIIESGTIELN